jgi:hypothetical protein
MTGALFVPTSMVSDWDHRGPAVIQWTAANRVAPPLPYRCVLLDHGRLPAREREQAERAVDRFLTREESASLGHYLQRAMPAWCAHLAYGTIELPISAAEARAMQAPGDDAEPGTFWLVRPAPHATPPPPLPFVGVVSLWPWPDLAPADVASLIRMRERIGLEPVPSLPADVHGILDG